MLLLYTEIILSVLFIVDAKIEGYMAVVSFLVIRDERFEWDNHVSIRLYEKNGFVKVSEQDGFVVMRKELLLN